MDRVDIIFNFHQSKFIFSNIVSPRGSTLNYMSTLSVRQAVKSVSSRNVPFSNNGIKMLQLIEFFKCDKK